VHFADTPDSITGTIRRHTPGAPEFSQQEKEDATACKIAISRGESPETLLKSRLESGTLSRPAAAVCLLEADEKSHIDGSLGQITLNWLWDQRSDLIYPDDNDLVYAMVRLVVREGEEEQILRWIRAETLRPSDLPPYISAHFYDATIKENMLNTSNPVRDARTALYHPRGPDPDPVLAMFLAAAADSDREHPLWTMRKYGTRHVFRMSATHGSEELRRQGRMEEARSLEKARDVNIIQCP
ncbi:hypothetical protein D6D18_10522, partial [Aureobasidium pullulans]